MPDQEKNLEQIDKYLNGEMSQSEQEAFRAAMEKDAELEQLYVFVKDTKSAIEYHEMANLKSTLGKTEYFLKQRKRNASILKIAASVLVIATFGYLIYQNSQVDNLALYDQYYQAYPNVVAPVSRSAANETNAYQLYENGNYEKALAIFEKQSPKNDTILFYIAQSQMALNMNREALNTLHSIEAQSKFYIQAEWYTALLHLGDGDLKKCEEKLLQIIDAGNSHSNRAKELLRQL